MDTAEAYLRACLLNRGDWVEYAPVKGSSMVNPALREYAGGMLRVLSSAGSYVLVDDPSKPGLTPFEVYRPHLRAWREEPGA
jgi:hypothetical protein